MVQDPNNYWEQLERLEKLIRASELKAAIIFSFHSLIIGIFIDRVVSFQHIFQESIVFIILTGLWLVFVLISLYYCFKCFMPQIESNYDKNVFFFRDTALSHGNIEEYTKKLMDVCESEEELFIQLSQQIYIESKIIERKFDCVNKSLKCFAVSIIFMIMTLIFWLIRL